MRILKYKLNLSEPTILEIPKRSIFLSIQLQNGFPVMWRLVNTSENIPLEKINIESFITGFHEINNQYMGSYCETIQCDNGLVFHFFEKHDNPIIIE